MIQKTGNNFELHTKNTTYLFRVLPTGHLEHLYYGASLLDGESAHLKEDDFKALAEKRIFEAGNMVTYSQKEKALTLEDLRLEVSGTGKGDIRESFVDVTFFNGSYTTDFIFRGHRVENDNYRISSLPAAHSKEEEAEHLIIRLSDTVNPLELELHYFVFYETDVIARQSILRNTGRSPVHVNRLMSLQLDLDPGRRKMITFRGAWAREMHPSLIPLTGAKVVNESHAGFSSNRANPFVMIADEGATETAGSCLGINLVYSGDHYTAAETNAYGKCRITTGMNPANFSWKLLPGEEFASPQAVMTCSDEGYRGVSLRMHAFVRHHILPVKWSEAERPVLLNSWEASYFKINESRLVKLAREAKACGIELFVMDDGWFRGRESDKRALGDWTPDLKKLPGGLSGISKKIHQEGLQFGIWIEPEMISTDSELYHRHPDWAVDIPGREHSEGRNQRLLDLAKPAVVDYLTEVFTGILSGAQIEYVKWDMNRIFSDRYFKSIPAERQREGMHRYILGFYQLAENLTERFPDILFEGCASGGNRFDLGALCYFPQIWASDDTDALERVKIQTGYSYGYPMNALTAHVSSVPNHQTLRDTPLSTRFGVASFGILGYELNLTDTNKKDLQEIRDQVELYKNWRDVLQNGTFYRGRTGEIMEWTVVSGDQKRAVGLIFQTRNKPNTQWETYRPAGLDPHKRYWIYNIKKPVDIRHFGDLINTASPIHIKQGGTLHDIAARFVSMPGEEVNLKVLGGVLMKGALHLPPAFSGTGYEEGVRFMPDYSVRMYFMEADD